MACGFISSFREERANCSAVCLGFDAFLDCCTPWTFHLSHVVRQTVFGFPTRSDANRASSATKGGLSFRFRK